MAFFIQFGDLPPDVLRNDPAPGNQDSSESHDDQSQSSQFQAPAEPENQDSGETHDVQSQSSQFQAPSEPQHHDSGESHGDQSQLTQFQAPAAELENQDSGETHGDQSQSLQFQAPADPENQDSEATHDMQPPVSPQLRFFLTKKPPRTPGCFSSTVLPPPRSNIAPPVVISSHVAAPSKWCCDNRLGNAGTFLSKDSLLPKMYRRWDLYRTFHIYTQMKLTGDMQYLGKPVDYFLTYPLKPSIKPEGEQVQQPPLLQGLPDHLAQDTSPVWANGLPSTRDTLNRHPGLGALPLGGRSFSWARNSTGTKVCGRGGFVNRGINKFTGFLECPKCGELFGISYGIDRFQYVGAYLEKMTIDMIGNAEKVLRKSHFSCMCDGKKDHPVRPFISDNFNKINWLCLILGLNLGFCTVDQLKYFCSQRNLEIRDNKHFLLFKVCTDLLYQISVL